MCELMGLSFQQPVSADFSIRAFSLRDSENADGWGLAWYPDRSVAVVKEALAWRQSGYSQFLETYHGLRAATYIAHVRHKTVGLDATHSDTHPFHRELEGVDYCFAHNGTIDGFTSLPLGRFNPIGRTDSEWVFCHLLNEIANRQNCLRDESGWQWFHETLSALNRHGKLNCLLSDGMRLFAYRDVNGWKGLCLRKLLFLDHDERHFEDASMDLTMTGESGNQGYAVATRPLSQCGWQSLAPGSLTVLETGKMQYATAPTEILSTDKNAPP